MPNDGIKSFTTLAFFHCHISITSAAILVVAVPEVKIGAVSSKFCLVSPGVVIFLVPLVL